jgi:hypothetical protein
MQTFYSQLFSPTDESEIFMIRLLMIANSRLEDLLSLRNELAWESWEATPVVKEG